MTTLTRKAKKSAEKTLARKRPHVGLLTENLSNERGLARLNTKTCLNGVKVKNNLARINNRTLSDNKLSKAQCDALNAAMNLFNSTVDDIFG